MTEPVDLGSPFLVAAITDRVLYVRIDRVERRNAMTQDMYRGVKRAAIRADGDAGIDLMCLTGTGPVFASGGDMGPMKLGDEATIADDADAVSKIRLQIDVGRRRDEGHDLPALVDERELGRTRAL